MTNIMHNKQHYSNVVITSSSWKLLMY